MTMTHDHPMTHYHPITSHDPSRPIKSRAGVLTLAISRAQIASAVREIGGLQLVGRADVCVVAFAGAPESGLNCYAVCDAMKVRAPPSLPAPGDTCARSAALGSIPGVTNTGPFK